MDKCVGTTVHSSFVFHSPKQSAFKWILKLHSLSFTITIWRGKKRKNNVTDGVHCCPELKIFQPCIILNFEKDGLLCCVYFLSPYMCHSFTWKERKILLTSVASF
ncbi:hypothetical protein PIB30_069694 [Stylosanthes scabra]|uniref:Uncharacterized protein n=1 Tax=Stylosanthes scabra TaxID=79078 RepID=A0ABU6ZMI5_9FABA|nr:hypothetical protein [Stylosanthes scabra]